jgi:hypothetical protein
MSHDKATPAPGVAAVAAHVPPDQLHSQDGFNLKQSHLESSEQRVDAIEMIGEETAAQMPKPGQSDVSPAMRYLHSSRTIHQLVTDRNRAVGLYLAVATLLWTASTSLLRADPNQDQIVPLGIIQYWCLPFTFGTMTVLAVLVAFLLVRTRVGLIYEVAKMNVLLGLPPGRVKRINPLSVFFIMHVIVCLAGGTSAGLLSLYLLRLGGMAEGNLGWPAFSIGALVAVLLIVLFLVSVKQITSDKKLADAIK